jgi:hypothetical protein
MPFVSGPSPPWESDDGPMAGVGQLPGLPQAHLSPTSRDECRRTFYAEVFDAEVGPPTPRRPVVEAPSHRQPVHLLFGVDQFAQQRRDKHQQVELKLCQVIAHRGVQPCVSFSAVIV